MGNIVDVLLEDDEIQTTFNEDDIDELGGILVEGDEPELDDTPDVDDSDDTEEVEENVGD